MKNRILFMLCFLILTFSLTACENEKPYEDTELEKETQSDTNIGEVENTQEHDTSIPFLGSDIVFYQVPKPTFESRIAKGHVAALIGTQVEWQKWLEQYMPEYTIQDKVFEQYNLDLFKNNYLIIYRGELGQYGHKTTGIERVFIENDDFRIEEFEFHNELLMIDSREQNYYIPYHMCWIKKNGVAEQLYKKYKVGSYQCVDAMNAYYIYPNLMNAIEVKYTHNGGVSWGNSELITDMVHLGDKEIEYYFLSPEVGYVLDVVTSAKNPPAVRLWLTEDGAESWQEISWVSEQMMQEYPMELLFFDEQKGIMLTDGRQSPILSKIGYPIYYTEDGGQTWNGIMIDYRMWMYEDLYVTGIERISEKEARLYVTVKIFPQMMNDVEGATAPERIQNCVYYTKDAGKTWVYQGTHVQK